MPDTPFVGLPQNRPRALSAFCECFGSLELCNQSGLFGDSKLGAGKKRMEKKATGRGSRLDELQSNRDSETRRGGVAMACLILGSQY